jgi:hypothetical protein
MRPEIFVASAVASMIMLGYISWLSAQKTLSQIYETELKRCRDQIPKGVSLSECIPKGVFTSRAFPEEKMTASACIGTGCFGSTYLVAHANIPLVLKFTQENLGLCSDKVALKILDGLNGFVPRVYEINSGIAPGCEEQILLMDQLGDSDWADVVETYKSETYRRFAKLLEAVRDLHEKGFVHRDLKGDNIRVKRFDSSYVALIDLGNAVPIGPGVYRRTDLQRLVLLFTGIDFSGIDQTPDWQSELIDEVDRYGKLDRPNYEKWIEFFEKIANEEIVRIWNICVAFICFGNTSYNDLVE